MGDTLKRELQYVIRKLTDYQCKSPLYDGFIEAESRVRAIPGRAWERGENSTFEKDQFPRSFGDVTCKVIRAMVVQ